MVQLLVYFAYWGSLERYAGALTSDSGCHVVPWSSLLYTGSVCLSALAVSATTVDFSNDATRRPLGS